MKKTFSIAFVALSSFLLSCKKDLTHSNGLESVRTVASSSRTAKQSNLLWQKSLGTTVNDYGSGIAKSSDGTAYYIAGSTIDATGHYDAYVVKTDLNGNALWQRTAAGSGNDDAQAVVATLDGGCLIAGYTESNDGDFVGMNRGVADVLLLRYDSDGNLLWKQTLGGSQYDRAWSLISTSDGNFALCGQTGSNDGDAAGSGSTNGLSKTWIVKFSIGNTGAAIQWQKAYGIDGGKDDVAYAINEESGQGFCVTGRTLSTSDDADILAINVSPTGDLLWKISFGTVSSGDVGFGITASPTNDGYVLTGYELTNLLIAKLDNSGNFAWQKTLSGSKAGGISGRSIASTNNGYLIIGGTASKNGDIVSAHGGQDFFAQQFGFDGSKTGTANVFGGTGDEIGKSVFINTDGTFVAVGQTSSTNGDVSGNHGKSDAWLVKFKF